MMGLDVYHRICENRKRNIEDGRSDGGVSREMLSDFRKYQHSPLECRIGGMPRINIDKIVWKLGDWKNQNDVAQFFSKDFAPVTAHERKGASPITMNQSFCDTPFK